MHQTQCTHYLRFVPDASDPGFSGNSLDISVGLKEVASRICVQGGKLSMDRIRDICPSDYGSSSVLVKCTDGSPDIGEELRSLSGMRLQGM